MIDEPPRRAETGAAVPSPMRDGAAEDTVSVIIPTFNRSAPLQRALASVFTQTKLPLEIIVVDDASADDTAAVMEALIAPVSVKYVRQRSNRGGGHARNVGICLAKGRYVAFLDSDDEWLPRHIESLLAVAVSETGDFLLSNSTVHVRGERRTVRSSNLCLDGSLASSLAFVLRTPLAFQSSTLLVPTVTVRRYQFDGRLRRHQDWDLVCRMLEGGARLRIVPEATTIYHDSGTAGVGLSPKLTPSLRFLARHRQFMSAASKLRFITLQIHRRRPGRTIYLASLFASLLTGAIDVKEYVHFTREGLFCKRRF